MVSQHVGADRRARRVRRPEPARGLRRLRRPDGRQPHHRHLRPAAGPGRPRRYRELPRRRPRRRQRVRPPGQLPRAHRQPGRRAQRAVGHRARARELRRLRRRSADRQLRRRPHQRVPRERRRHLDPQRLPQERRRATRSSSPACGRSQFGFGNANSGARNHLYFTAGPIGESRGRDGPDHAQPARRRPAPSRRRSSLTLGPAASARHVRPGRRRRLHGDDTATVISTAGDAMLTVSDPSATAPGRLINGTFAAPPAAPGRRTVARRRALGRATPCAPTPPRSATTR